MAPVLLLVVILAVLAGAALFITTSGHVSAPVTPSASAPARPPAPPAISAPAPPQRRVYPQRYAVRPGDTLWHIAATRCGDPLRWTSLWHANKITNPDLIFPGEVIILNC